MIFMTMSLIVHFQTVQRNPYTISGPYYILLDQFQEVCYNFDFHYLLSTSPINIIIIITACNGILHMANEKILVIGGVAAGSSAASKAKRINPDADVKIIQDEKVVSYGACGMPYVIEGIVKDFQELIERPPDVFKKEYKIDVIINTRAQKIDRIKKGSIFNRSAKWSRNNL